MDYYKILQRSWEIVKRQKVLWVFGMVLAVFAGGGGGFQSGGNFDSFGEFLKRKKEIPPETGEKISAVLGAMTSDPGAFFASMFSQIPPLFWVALVLGILILVAFGLVFGIFVRNWATGAIFGLVSEIEKGGEATLEKGSTLGRRSWKRLFLASLIIWGGLLLGAFLGIFFSVVLILILPSPLKLIILIPLALGVIILIILAFVMILWEIFAKLVITLEDYPIRHALSFSWKLTKKFFWEGVVLGLINTGIGCLVGCGTMTVIILAIGLIVIGFLVHKSIGIFLLLCLGTLGLILILGGVLIQGILKAFTSSNWVLMYLELKKKDPPSFADGELR